jgi:hypothetical protein
MRYATQITRRCAVCYSLMTQSSGDWFCTTPEFHNSDKVLELAIARGRDSRLVKKQLIFQADSVGPSARYRKDVRTVVLLYTDGSFVTVCHVMNEMAMGPEIIVNSLTIRLPNDMNAQELFRNLTGLSTEEFDESVIDAWATQSIASTRPTSSVTRLLADSSGST